MKPLPQLTAGLSLLAALAGTNLASAQNASFTNYGSGCTSGGPPPLIQALSLPVLGSTMTVRYVALPAGQSPVSIDWPMLIMGLQQTNTPVPPLSSFQPPNCTILVSPDVVIPMVWSGSSYPNTYALAIPNNNALAGYVLHLQFLDIYFRCQPTCDLQMIRATNAGTAVLGF